MSTRALDPRTFWPRAGWRLAPLLLALTLAGLTGVSRAAWVPDGTRVSVAPMAQISPALAPDGAGGAFTAWADSASGTLPAGWQSDGNSVTAYSCFKYVVSIVPDGAGGAILVWSDDHCLTHRDLLAQRLTASGAVAPGWPAAGLAVCLASGNQDSPLVISDDAGGAFVAWEDWRSGSSMIYAQHVLGTGSLAPGWPRDGVAVCPAGGGESLPVIARDGADGVFIAWQDRRTGIGDIYLERLDGSGALAPGWPAEGLLVGGATGNQGSPAMISDGAGGVFISWLDHRWVSDDIYAARISGDGTLAPGWTADGAAVCTAAGDQRKPVICADGAGGLLVAWQDRRAGNWDIFAQRLDGEGAPAGGWSEDGVALCAASGDQLGVQIVSDAAGGAYLVWQDPRSGSSHIYAQPRIVADDAGGALVVWVDSRTANPNAPDLYAQRLLSAGVTPTGPTNLAARHQDGQTFLTWTCPTGTGWTYRLYASPNPIVDSSSLAGATLLGSVGDSTWYDRRLSVLTGQTWAYRADSAASPLAPDQGLFVVTPLAAGSSFYAVTAQAASYPDNPAVSAGLNALADPVAEQLEAPRPVWQRQITVSVITPNIYTEPGFRLRRGARRRGAEQRAVRELPRAPGQLPPGGLPHRPGRVGAGAG